MEEEEARKIHQRMMSELENVDLDSELFIVSCCKLNLFTECFLFLVYYS